MESFELSPEAHHYLGIELNIQTWRLLEQDQLTDKDKRRMEHFALGSLYHWHRSMKFAAVNAQRGHWMLARVYAVTGEPEKSLEQARICMTLTQELNLSGFDLGYAHEALARALAASEDFEAAATTYGEAMSVPIAGEEDQRIFLGDLQAEPWFGLERP